MKMNKMKNVLAIMLSFAFATGCSNSKNGKSKVDTHQLLDKEWKLIEVKDQMVPESSTAGFLLSKDRKITGSTGCNRMTGTYDLIKNREIKFGPLGTTRMACVEETVSNIERMFLEVLSSTNEWAFENEELILKNGNNTLARLKGMDASAKLNGHWELTNISGPRIAFKGLYPEKIPTITFNLADSSASGNSSCNSYTVPVEVKGENISVGEGLSTLMACEGEGEMVYLQTLRKVKTYQISEDQTTLELMLEGVPMMRFIRK